MEMKPRHDLLGTRVSLLGLKHVFDAIKALEAVHKSRDKHKYDLIFEKMDDLAQELSGLLVGSAFTTNMAIPALHGKCLEFSEILSRLAIRASVFLASEYNPKDLATEVVADMQKELKILCQPSVHKDSFRNYCRIRNMELTAGDETALGILRYLAEYITEILKIFQAYNGTNIGSIFDVLCQLIPEAERPTVN